MHKPSWPTARYARSTAYMPLLPHMHIRRPEILLIHTLHISCAQLHTFNRAHSAMSVALHRVPRTRATTGWFFEIQAVSLLPRTQVLQNHFLCQRTSCPCLPSQAARVCLTSYLLTLHEHMPNRTRTSSGQSASAPLLRMCVVSGHPATTSNSCADCTVWVWSTSPPVRRW